jgi:HD-like signal output (HDOD) protein/ActR/RegA family two-component response regulator
MAVTKRTILVVGDPSTELPEACRELAQLAPQWEWQTATTGLGALDALTRQPFDAVVADLRLSDLTGLQLLNRVMAQWPETHRVILADLGDVDALIRCVGGAHPFLARPCDAQRLLVVLVRAFTLDLWLPNRTVRRLLGSLPLLPSPAEDYHAIIECMEQSGLEAAAGRIAVDPPMAAKVLQLANSAAWGPPLDEASPIEAARGLGLTNVRRVLLLAHTYSSFREAAAAGFGVVQFWTEARRAAQLARSIAQSEGVASEVVEQSATGGLLHNLGKLALVVNHADSYGEVIRRQRELGLPAWEAEQRVFGATHGEVGGYLLGLWGVPMPVIEAVAFHHHPTCFLSNRFNPLTAVHVANALLASRSLEESRSRLDVHYLGALHLEGRLGAWWACREALSPLDGQP